MKKLIILSLVLLSTIGFSHAQADYTTAVGFRAGLSQGITLKHFMKSDAAIDGILATRWGGFHITGLYEIHQTAFDVKNLNWYYGAGAHIGVWDGDASPWFDEDKNHTVVGVDGVLGIEYTIAEIPFCIGLDYKPGFNIIGYTGFWGDELALSIRYIFK